MSNEAVPQDVIDANLVAIANQQGDKFAEYERGSVRDPRTGRIVKSEHGLNNELNFVTFSVEPVLHKVNTYKAKRPVYVDREFVTIVCPGKEREFTVHRPVEQFDIWSYPHEYENFKKGLAAQQSGTPLALFTQLTPSQIKELEYHGIRTVEQLAGAADNIAVNAITYLKDKAREFLQKTADTAAVSVLSEQLEQQQKKHETEVDALKAQMAALMAMLEKNKKDDKEQPEVAEEDSETEAPERKSYYKRKTS